MVNDSSDTLHPLKSKTFHGKCLYLSSWLSHTGSKVLSMYHVLFEDYIEGEMNVKALQRCL